ncbi:hypothetical protein VNO80_05991 [Phaseolus coccineus]|uniref:Uncharacterized protein n=1 Tax=Phaseolus coccineus TaxID=3886 RepID=A0AAN9RE59_PHACN
MSFLELLCLIHQINSVILREKVIVFLHLLYGVAMLPKEAVFVTASFGLSFSTSHALLISAIADRSKLIVAFAFPRLGFSLKSNVIYLPPNQNQVGILVGKSY